MGQSAMGRFFTGRRPVYSVFRTTVDDLIAEGDRVVARIRHDVTFASDWESPIGHVAAAGREGSWNAVATFRIADGKFIEQWVVRDDVSLLKAVGALPAGSLSGRFPPHPKGGARPPPPRSRAPGSARDEPPPYRTQAPITPRQGAM